MNEDYHNVARAISAVATAVAELVLAFGLLRDALRRVKAASQPPDPSVH